MAKKTKEESEKGAAINANKGKTKKAADVKFRTKTTGGDTPF